MSKPFIEVVQDSPKVGLGTPVETKKPLSLILPLAGPPFSFKLRKRLFPVLSLKPLLRHPLARGPAPRLRARLANRGVAPARGAYNYSSHILICIISLFIIILFSPVNSIFMQKHNFQVTVNNTNNV